MKQLSAFLASIKKLRKDRGFTMIELLIVISILGILAVAVLSAINPIEQINRGRDTGSQSDAEQLISAIDRYYAFNGTYPWQGTGAAAANNDPVMAWSQVSDTTGGNDQPAGTTILSELLEKNELKEAFINRVQSAVNPLFIYNEGGNGDSTYVCFLPQSQSFLQQAKDRCVDLAGSGLPGDVDATTRGLICADAIDPNARTTYHCLP